MFLDKILKNSKGEYVGLMEILLGKSELENYIYTLAEAHAIDLIARTIAKCEIETFELVNKKIENRKGELYWLLNIQPNFNENGTSFIYKLVCKLLIDKTALVLINENTKNRLLYVADEYNCTDKVLKEKTFTNITVSDCEGNSFILKKEYNSENTIYFCLKNDGLNVASEGFKKNSTKILKAAQKSFIKANTGTWLLKKPGTMPTLVDLETQKPISMEAYKEKLTEGLFSEEEAVVLLSEQFDLNNLNKDNTKNLSDFENTFLRISKTVAQKWNIPLDVFWGDFTDKSNGTNNFITLAVDPYFEILNDGFNIGLVGKESYLKGEYVAFNRSSISHRDVMDCGTGIDKLTANKFSRNEINKLLRLPHIDEEWADEHALTKNYEKLEGGVKGNEE